jgi:hypothetical protein
MITNNYIYQNHLTRPYIYYNLWIHPTPPPTPVRICYFDHFTSSDPGDIGSYIKVDSIYGEFVSSQLAENSDFYVASKPGGGEYYVRTTPQEGYYQTSKLVVDGAVYVRFPGASGILAYVRAEPIVGSFISSIEESTNSFISSKVSDSSAYTTSRPSISGSYVSSKPGCNPWIIRS